MEARTKAKALRALPPAALEQQGRLAGVVSRTVVLVLDLIAVAVITGSLYLVLVVFLLVTRPRRFHWPSLTTEEVISAALVVCVIYLTTAWSTTGRSFGKRIMGLRVVDRRGRHLTLRRAFLRALACTVLPILLFWSAVSRKNRSVQDILLRTSVIYDWESDVSRVVIEPATSGSKGDPLRTGVDVAPAVADEADDGHAEALPRADGE